MPHTMIRNLDVFTAKLEIEVVTPVRSSKVRGSLNLGIFPETVGEVNELFNGDRSEKVQQ